MLITIYLGTVVLSTSINSYIYNKGYEKYIKNNGYLRNNNEDNDIHEIEKLDDIFRHLFVNCCPIFNILFASYSIAKRKEIFELMLNQELKKGDITRSNDINIFYNDNNNIDEIKDINIIKDFENYDNVKTRKLILEKKQ